ncbi:MAG: hypothetical protein CMC82_08615 [Flavobacteriaceae bacterium]|nr:hypothetical protein [Flavobacteriaceae bacterium]|tara:strand:+ start:312 stop:758 length:447 start_codon:yes stop_codon:yes gene_type:complete
MKIWGLFLIFSLLFFACTNPKPKPQAPSVNWTPLDEPPLYPDCPQENSKSNWDCFAKTLQKKLNAKWAADKLSFDDLNDTLYVTLKLDKLGQLSVMNYKNGKQLQSSPVVLTSFEELVASLPLFQPAFKTNLEVAVEVQWTLPIVISK